MRRKGPPRKVDAPSPPLPCGLSRPSDLLGRRILIFGEVNTGKTTLSKSILDALCACGLSSRIAVIDMAPKIPERIALERGIKGVGGKLLPHGSDVLYLATALKPPRLSARTEEEALRIAEENKEKIEVLLEAYPPSGRDILFVNDVSIYLHAGTTERLLGYMAEATTIVANGYHGMRLGAGPITLHEAAEMEKLIEAFPCRISLPARE